MNKKALEQKLIQDYVKSEVTDVKSLLRNLLEKRLERAQEVEAIQQPQAKPSINVVSYINNLDKELEDLQIEILQSPSTETVRQVKRILSEIRSKLPQMTQADVKLTLDKLFNLMLYVGINDQRGKNKNSNHYAESKPSLFSKGNAKANDVRRLIQEMIIKFLHEMSGMYLGNSMLYPQSYEDLRDNFNLSKRTAEEAIKIVQNDKDVKVRRKAFDDSLAAQQQAALETLRKQMHDMDEKEERNKQNLINRYRDEWKNEYGLLRSKEDEKVATAKQNTLLARKAFDALARNRESSIAKREEEVQEKKRKENLEKPGINYYHPSIKKSVLNKYFNRHLEEKDKTGMTWEILQGLKKDDLNNMIMQYNLLPELQKTDVIEQYLPGENKSHVAKTLFDDAPDHTTSNSTGKGFKNFKKLFRKK